MMIRPSRAFPVSPMIIPRQNPYIHTCTLVLLPYIQTNPTGRVSFPIPSLPVPCKLSISFDCALLAQKSLFFETYSPEPHPLHRQICLCLCLLAGWPFLFDASNVAVAGAVSFPHTFQSEPTTNPWRTFFCL